MLQANITASSSTLCLIGCLLTVSYCQAQLSHSKLPRLTCAQGQRFQLLTGHSINLQHRQICTAAVCNDMHASEPLYIRTDDASVPQHTSHAQANNGIDSNAYCPQETLCRAFSKKQTFVMSSSYESSMNDGFVQNMAEVQCTVILYIRAVGSNIKGTFILCMLKCTVPSSLPALHEPPGPSSPLALSAPTRNASYEC